MNPLFSTIFTKIFPKKSRARRLQYKWLLQQRHAFTRTEKILDLGGVRNAEYHKLLSLDPNQIFVWNFDQSTTPDQLVDLEKTQALPSFPKNCTSVIALNLLEHLYAPFELVQWVCKNLPAQGKLLILVPFHYPIHPSPNDYWRITPQAFEHFFKELEKKSNITGALLVQPLGEDLREGASALTADLFKAGPIKRIIASITEGLLWLISQFIPHRALNNWAKNNPVSIGIIWTKN